MTTQGSGADPSDIDLLKSFTDDYLPIKRISRNAIYRDKIKENIWSCVRRPILGDQRILHAKLSQDDLTYETALMLRMPHHCSLAMILGYDTIDHRWYVAEAINGPSLEARTRRDNMKLSAMDVVATIIQLISVLHLLHESGIAHGDIAEDNVYCTGPPGNECQTIMLSNFARAVHRDDDSEKFEQCKMRDIVEFGHFVGRMNRSMARETSNASLIKLCQFIENVTLPLPSEMGSDIFSLLWDHVSPRMEQLESLMQVGLGAHSTGRAVRSPEVHTAMRRLREGTWKPFQA
ncbi:MAG: hypothetical protein M1828_007594 [Chrysothrix sp. TS-e1954]|nr:MAG: hypothetical protein M1828_007594 [Chrysothrix sp. TS-e1954]